MNKEDKQSLLKDLLPRLLYGVKVRYSGEIPMLGKVTNNIGVLSNIFVNRYFYPFEVNGGYYCYDDIKPYLRSMDDMTEEEKEEMHKLLSPEGTAIYENDGISMPMNHCGEFVPYDYMYRIIQYLLEHHFDFMGLIPKGLAIAVTEENNPYKE